MEKLNCRRDKLWQGCILASIAHAINVAHYPEFNFEQSWDGINYNVQDGSGARGTITFHPTYLVAAFRDDNNDRLTGDKEALDYFTNAPDKVKTLALNETLQYLLENVNGNTVPIITTSFWATNDDLYSQDTTNEMIKSGGFLLEKQMLDVGSALNVWQNEYEMSESQIQLLVSIFQRKKENISEVIVLTEDEIKMIGSEDQEGLTESKNSFRELGVEWVK